MNWLQKISQSDVWYPNHMEIKQLMIDRGYLHSDEYNHAMEDVENSEDSMEVEQLEKSIWDTIIENYEYASDEIYSRIHNGKLPVYRMITANSVHDVRLDDLGIFWSWSADAADSHWGTSGSRHVLITGEVDVNNVDWESTWYANATESYAHEREITLKGGSPVNIISIEDLGDYMKRDQTLEEPLRDIGFGKAMLIEPFKRSL